MKNKIILEIGKNHLGKNKILFDYLKVFNLDEVYGFTMQLRNNEFYNKKNKILKIDNNTILKFKNKCKTNNKKFGLSIQSQDNFQAIDIIQPDFIKVLSYSTQDFEFCKKIRKKYKVPIYFSLGLIKKNQSHKFIDKFFKIVSKKNTFLIYTKIENLIFDFSLDELSLLNKKFKNKIAYGHHFNSTRLPAIMELLNISTFFLYIKNLKKLKYPDNLNAFNINDLKKLLKFAKLLRKIK